MRLSLLSYNAPSFERTPTTTLVSLAREEAVIPLFVPVCITSRSIYVEFTRVFHRVLGFARKYLSSAY